MALAENVPGARNTVKDKKGNEWVVFGKTVHHPGSQPRPFMRPAARANKRFYMEGLKRAIKKA